MPGSPRERTCSGFTIAGYGSSSASQWIYDRRLWFIVRVKEKHLALKAELRRLLAAWQAAGGARWAAEERWERSKGELIRRQIWRTEQIAGYSDWLIRHGWVVQVTHRDDAGQEKTEFR
ncbi:MAG: hypothetical protein HYV63_33535 [Candidatus Schekmanbacteria bacterium]|nr:hypothetical protein [Candidatus Schekmanbacteria bacterium]